MEGTPGSRSTEVVSRSHVIDDRESIVALRATIDLAPIGIAHLGLDGRFLFANRKLCAILRYGHGALLERTFQEITFRDDLERCVALNAQLASGAIPSYAHEKRFVRGD